MMLGEVNMNNDLFVMYDDADGCWHVMQYTECGAYSLVRLPSQCLAYVVMGMFLEGE